MNEEEADDLFKKYQESGISGNSISLNENNLSVFADPLKIQQNSIIKSILTLPKPINFDDLAQDNELQTKEIKRELHKSPFLINYINSLKNK